MATRQNCERRNKQNRAHYLQVDIGPDVYRISKACEHGPEVFCIADCTRQCRLLTREVAVSDDDCTTVYITGTVAAIRILKQRQKNWRHNWENVPMGKASSPSSSIFLLCTVQCHHHLCPLLPLCLMSVRPSVCHTCMYCIKTNKSRLSLLLRWRILMVFSSHFLQHLQTYASVNFVVNSLYVFWSSAVYTQLHYTRKIIYKNIHNMWSVRKLKTLN